MNFTQFTAGTKIYNFGCSFFTEAVFEKRCWERYIINEINPYNTAGGVRVDMNNVNSMNDCETFCEAVGINFSALTYTWLSWAKILHIPNVMIYA